VLLFGHIGCGHGLVTPWRRTLPFWGVTLGALLPDLIDKALYYGAHGHLVTTTRTFGHTGIALAIAWALAPRGGAMIGLAAGATTHVVLDLGMDLLAPASRATSSAWIALTWPLHGFAFPAEPYTNLSSHLGLLLGDPRVVVSEIVGVALTVWALRRRATYDTGWTGTPAAGRAQPRTAATRFPMP
jgi:hypothetical protein